MERKGCPCTPGRWRLSKGNPVGSEGLAGSVISRATRMKARTPKTKPGVPNAESVTPVGVDGQHQYYRADGR